MGDTGTWRGVREGTRQRQEGRAGAEHEGPHARRHWCALLWSHTGPSPGCSANRSLSRAVREGRALVRGGACWRTQSRGCI